MTNLSNSRGQIKWIMDKEKSMFARADKNEKDNLAYTQDIIDTKMKPMIADIAAHCDFSLHKELKDAKKKRILRLLLDRLKKLAVLNISIEELMEDKPFPSSPLERPEAELFIDHAKKGNNLAMRRMLRRCRYFVYQFDHVDCQ